MSEHKPQIKFYLKERCPLCENAKQALDLVISDHPMLQYEEIDIYSRDEWLEKYQLMIPVVEVDGEVIAYGQISYADLKEKLIAFIK